jgi:hypothetical protein
MSHRPRQETLQEENAQGGTDRVFWLIPRYFGRAFLGVPNPEEEARRVRASANLMRAAAFERAYGTKEGQRPRRADPMSGTGMKEARQATRGAKHREGEKP